MALGCSYASCTAHNQRSYELHFALALLRDRRLVLVRWWSVAVLLFRVFQQLLHLRQLRGGFRRMNQVFHFMRILVEGIEFC